MAPRVAVAVLLFVTGVAIWLACLDTFSRHGRGTPLPVDAPRLLVTSGFFAVVRNPIMLAELLVIWAEALYVASARLPALRDRDQRPRPHHDGRRRGARAAQAVRRPHTTSTAATYPGGCRGCDRGAVWPQPNEEDEGAKRGKERNVTVAAIVAFVLSYFRAFVIL